MGTRPSVNITGWGFMSLQYLKSYHETYRHIAINGSFIMLQYWGYHVVGTNAKDQLSAIEIRLA